MALSEQLKNTNNNETLTVNVTDTLNSRASPSQKKKPQHPVHKGNNNQKNKVCISFNSVLNVNS